VKRHLKQCAPWRRYCVTSGRVRGQARGGESGCGRRGSWREAAGPAAAAVDALGTSADASDQGEVVCLLHLRMQRSCTFHCLALDDLAPLHLHSHLTRWMQTVVERQAGVSHALTVRGACCRWRASGRGVNRRRRCRRRRVPALRTASHLHPARRRMMAVGALQIAHLLGANRSRPDVPSSKALPRCMERVGS